MKWVYSITTCQIALASPMFARLFGNTTCPRMPQVMHDRTIRSLAVDIENWIVKSSNRRDWRPNRGAENPTEPPPMPRPTRLFVRATDFPLCRRPPSEDHRSRPQPPPRLDALASNA